MLKNFSRTLHNSSLLTTCSQDDNITWSNYGKADWLLQLNKKNTK